MRIIAKNNTVVVRPSYEPLKRLSRFASTGETFDTPLGKVKTDNFHTYDNATGRSSMAWGEVVSVGSGPAWMAGRGKLDLPEGAIVGFDVSSEVSLDVEGQREFLVPVDRILCRFDTGMSEPAPLGAFIMTREEEGAGQNLTFSGPAKKFILPRSQAQGEIKVSDSPHSQVKMTVERVVDVGPGGMAHSEIRTELSVHEEVREHITMAGHIGSRVVSSKVLQKRQTPVWIEPERGAIGRLALFLFTMSVDCYVQGIRHRFTNWDRVRGLVEE